MDATITIKIDKKGNVTTDVLGAEGSVCEALTQPITDVLGKIVEHERKDEYYREGDVEEHQRVR